MFKFQFAPMMDADAGIDIPVSSESAVETPVGSPDSAGEVETGEQQTAAGADQQQSAKDFAFSKRLEAEKVRIREEMQRELAEKYQGYDDYREVAEYFREVNGVDNVLTLKEQIELERLNERAERQQVPPEVQRRIEELETKAAKADELQRQQELNSWYKDFRGGLEKFAGEKGVEADALERFMVDKGINDMDLAYRAYAFSDVEAKKAEIEKAAVQEYLKSKQAPKVEGAGSAGYVAPSTPSTWEQARSNAVAMMRAARENE